MEHDLADDYYPLLLTARHRSAARRDRYPHRELRIGPGAFQLTPAGKYDDYTASPVHRFYQMWQQTDCTCHRHRRQPRVAAEDLFRGWK